MAEARARLQLTSPLLLYFAALAFAISIFSSFPVVSLAGGSVFGAMPGLL